MLYKLSIKSPYIPIPNFLPIYSIVTIYFSIIINTKITYTKIINIPFIILAISFFSWATFYFCTFFLFISLLYLQRYTFCSSVFLPFFAFLMNVYCTCSFYSLHNTINPRKVTSSEYNYMILHHMIGHFLRYCIIVPKHSVY